MALSTKGSERRQQRSFNLGPETLPARTACNSNSVRHIFRLWGTLFCPVEFMLAAQARGCARW